MPTLARPRSWQAVRAAAAAGLAIFLHAWHAHSPASSPPPRPLAQA